MACLVICKSVLGRTTICFDESYNLNVSSSCYSVQTPFDLGIFIYKDDHIFEWSHRYFLNLFLTREIKSFINV